VQWLLCGSTSQSDGCYGSGTLGPFVAVGSILESDPVSIVGNTVTRYIYVVDTGATPVTMYVYKKTISVTVSDATVVISPYKTLPLLPLVGGTNVPTFMAANGKFLFIGTSISAQAVRVAKSNLTVQALGSFSPPINVSSITSNSYGYVTVTQGGSSGGFTLYGPEGNGVEDGGGGEVVVGTTQAVQATSYLTK